MDGTEDFVSWNDTVYFWKLQNSDSSDIEERSECRESEYKIVTTF